MALPLRQEALVEATECVSCGIQFTVPAAWLQTKRDNGDGFYCPNGHSLRFKEGEVRRLRALLESQTRNATEMTARAVAAERAEKRTKAELRRIKTRVSVGVCPCCNRTFQNLARHMKTKHPEMAKPEEAPHD
jgi:NMD protein affecting ribosome stability and mRNA decay